MLLYGAAGFGVIDHAWNGELFAFTIPDLLLGFVITAALVVGWGIWMLFSARTAAPTASVH